MTKFLATTVLRKEIEHGLLARLYWNFSAQKWHQMDSANTPLLKHSYEIEDRLKFLLRSLRQIE